MCWILPRKKHRPWQFLQRETEYIAESSFRRFRGVLITPLQKDFEKITEIQIELLLVNSVFFYTSRSHRQISITNTTVGILSEPEVKFCLRGDFRSNCFG